MNSRTTLGLLLAVCVTGLFILLVERRTPSTPERAVAAGRALPIIPEAVTFVRIEHGDFVVEFRRKPDGWFLVAPVEARARDGSIEHLLGTLETLPRLEVISGADRKKRGLRLQDYNLDEPWATLTLADAADQRQLRIGYGGPLPGVAYLKWNASEEILATTTNILGAVPGNLAGVRDRRLFHGDPARVNVLEITRRGAAPVKLRRRGDEWVFEQPWVWRANRVQTWRLLERLWTTEAEDFVVDRGADPNAYGLGADDAPLQVTVGMEGAEAGMRVVFGKTSDDTGAEVYAGAGNLESVCAVGREIVDVLSIDAEALRDRRVFRRQGPDVLTVVLQQGERQLELQRKRDAGWFIARPVQCRADDAAVESLVSNITALTVERFLGEADTNVIAAQFSPPGLVIEIGGEAATSAVPEQAEAAGGVAGGGLPERLCIGPGDRERARLPARLEGSPTLFEVSRAAVAGISEGDPSRGLSCTDPLIYRDHVMMALDPGSVKTITLAKAGREQAVERMETGEWKPAGSGTGEVQEAAIRDLLAAASSLRALRIEREDAADRHACGLDDSGIALTLGLSGRQGIQKKIIIGGPAGSDGTYAMVQGQDLVFILPRETADRLVRDLIR
jgi:hypothetical protein